MQKKVSESH